MIPIPGIPYIKLAAGLAIGLTIFFAYRFITNYVDAAELAKKDLALAEIQIVQKDAAIKSAKAVEAIRNQFQDEKVQLIDGFQAERQANLDSQAARIENMGTAGHMAEVSAMDNGFSRGNERLTFRAQARTDEISRRLEALSRHENLYSDPDPINSGNP